MLKTKAVTEHAHVHTRDTSISVENGDITQSKIAQLEDAKAETENPILVIQFRPLLVIWVAYCGTYVLCSLLTLYLPLWLQWGFFLPVLPMFIIMGRRATRDIQRSAQTLRELNKASGGISDGAVGERPDRKHPLMAEYLLHLIVSRVNREPLIADLHEEYEPMCEKFGKRKADFWYWKQVCDSLYPLLVGFLRRLRTWGVGGGLLWLCNHFAPSLAPTIQQWFERFASR